MIPAALRRAPWAVDPLSWITTNNLPAAVALASAAYAVIDLGRDAALDRTLSQLPAVLMLLVGHLGLHVLTRPVRAPFIERWAWVVVATGATALLLSALSYGDQPFAIGQWWVTVGVAMLLVGLAPYSTVLQLVRYGGVLLVATVLIAVTLVSAEEQGWPLLTIVMLAATPVSIGLVSSVVFSGTVSYRVTRWSERPIVVPSVDVGARRAEAQLAASVDAAAARRIAPAQGFLRELLERSEITADDRRRARELGDALRAELVAVANQTWLQRVVDGHPVEVDDPDRLADDLSLPQRAALRALLDALLAHPDSGFVSARIELVAAEGRSVAVGIRLLSTLPEGRRVTFLAPYYVTLQSTVRSIRWRNGAHLEAEFDVSGNDDGRPSLVQRAPAPIPARPRL
ncbi:hypothetical protein OVN18_08375 [Microcella daejeonensis]|uniref:Uncharacterized protein n=1 Tax=Microcella daejeonensis TaxID=2994971 RepID=A0A9E8S851_9MICO|nr:hypothetical protein [Microcella daejeonensis]WAB80584.1 hypothetical protein OVN18_08375 [Microcella daejeonensis]